MIKMDDVWMAVDGPSPRSRPRADVTHGASRVSMRASVLASTVPATRDGTPRGRRSVAGHAVTARRPAVRVCSVGTS